MGDLISREAAIAIMQAKGDMAVGTPGIVFYGAANILEMLPAVDAEPVRRGHWIKCNGKSHIWYCSECGDRINYNQARRTYKPDARPVSAVNKYCRCCGAKMDGTEK